VTPSLFRLPLDALFPANRGHWAGLSITAGYALLLVSAYGLSVFVRQHVVQVSKSGVLFSWLAAVFLLALGLGSTSIFLLSRPVVHHEAIMWSSALGLCSIYLVFRHVFVGDRWALGVAAILALLTIHTRVPAGLTAASACAIGAAARVLFMKRRDASENVLAWSSMLIRSPSVLFAIAAGALVVASYVAMNYARFGTIEAIPLRNYVSSGPALEARLQGRLFDVGNIRWNLSNHFGTEGLKSATDPPFVGTLFRMQGEVSRDQEQSRYPEARIGGIEPYVSIPVGMTGLLALSIVGIVGTLLRSRRWILVALLLPALIGPLLSLTFAYVSYRYLHEYIIFFVLTGSIAISQIAERGGYAGRVMASLLAVVVAANVLLNIDFAIHYQTSETNLGPPIKEMEDAVDRIRSLGQTLIRIRH
jgi:hypothetical protein